MRTDQLVILTKKFITSFQNHDSIKLIQDRDKEKNIEIQKHYDEIQALISNAEEIIIIGFSFDRDNLDILGFPSSLKEWEKFDKVIKYMDFNGAMGGLYEQFKRAQLHNHKKVIRSIASKIENAYQNDFKIFLY